MTPGATGACAEQRAVKRGQKRIAMVCGAAHEIARRQGGLIVHWRRSVLYNRFFEQKSI